MANKQRTVTIMEVCGTHTMAIARHGLRKSFPAGVRMVSGPGCPVCVTPVGDIDRAIALGGRHGIILATFGDMLRVPGSASSLEKERARGADVRVVYSPVDALEIAGRHPRHEVVFVGVGFETTAPAIAATVLLARKKGIGNFSVLPMFKTVPNALRFLLDAGKPGTGVPRIDAFLLPGHVSVVIGTAPYRFIAEEFGVPAVISGFEPNDILRSVDMILAQQRAPAPRIEVQYTRAVRPEGNREAQRLLDAVFTPADAAWRAIGTIEKSGLAFSASYADFDAARKFDLPLSPAREPKGCLCGTILLGIHAPRDCGLFGRRCTPAHPVGPCMVSSEGSCAAEYKYGG